jgi:CYTH domain-containing protein
MSTAPKYSLPEIERRWLVDLPLVGSLEHIPPRLIEDLYLTGTRLRLRKIVWPDTRVEFKLCKKYGKTSVWSEQITNLYLEEHEYRELSALPGRRSRKRRYAIAGGSLDIYESPNADLALFEIEFTDEHAASIYAPPPFVTREITATAEFSGASLAMNGNA